MLNNFIKNILDKIQGNSLGEGYVVYSKDMYERPIPFSKTIRRNKMTEIKLSNGNNIEVTKQGLLIKGNNIRVNIGGTDVVAIIGDNSYSVHEDTQTTTRGTVGRFEGDTSVKQAKTNLELEDMINELSAKVTSLSSSLATKSYVSDAISSEITRAQSRLTNKSYGQ